MIKINTDIRVLDIDKIKEADVNANQLTQVEFEKLKDDIQVNGFVDPVKVRKVEDGYVLVDGHHRFKAMKELGEEKITAIILENDDNQAKINAIRFNTERGHINKKILGDVIKSLQDANYSLDRIEHELVYDAFQLKDSLSLLELPDNIEDIIQEVREKESKELPIIYSFVVRGEDKETVDKALSKFGKKNTVLTELCKTIQEIK